MLVHRLTSAQPLYMMKMSDAMILYSYQVSLSPHSNSSTYTDVYDDYDGPVYPSQPCIGGKHGALYTPPGWNKVNDTGYSGTFRVRVNMPEPMFFVALSYQCTQASVCTWQLNVCSKKFDASKNVRACLQVDI